MTESKVVPLDEITSSGGPRSNSIHSRSSDRQHWAAEDTSATRGCCTRLAACLGFSATAAPWWAESILPGDNDVMATRDGWCEKTIDDTNIYAAKRRAEQRADRHKHLTQIGAQVEVLVGAHRGWYVGKVIDNLSGDDGQTTQFVTVKFINGSVLRNVRPIELRQVARMTWVYWAYQAFFVLIFTTCGFITRINAEHSLREGPRGDVWLFPDRAFTHMANTTLYSLTYGEVAAADGHPQTWLTAILNTKVEEYRNLPIFGAGRNDTLCWFRDSQDHLMWQTLYFFIFIHLAALPHLNILRVLPFSYHVVFNIMTAVICSQQQFNRYVSTYWSSQYPDYTREQMREHAEAAATGYAIIMTANFGFVHIVLPIFYSLLRRAGMVRWLVRYLPPYFFAGFLLWTVLYMRVAYFQFLLQDVLDRDNTLERLASIMIYLETTKQYMDRGLFFWLPLLIFLRYASFKIRTFKWYNYLITGIMIILVVPYVMWYYVVAQPLMFFEPVNWMVLHTRLSHEILLAPNGLFFLFTFGGVMIVCFEFALDWLYDAISIEYRVRSLDVRTRKALRAWAQSLSRKKVLKKVLKVKLRTWARSLSTGLKQKTKASRTQSAREIRSTAVANANNYQPLHKRAPTRDALRLIADHFESYLMQPGVRLRRRMWGPRWFTLFSAPMQVHRVIRVMGTTIACYAARVVNGAGPGQRQALRETLVALVEDLGCHEEDRQLVFDLADQDQPTGGGPSSINELREVTRRLGTKHRDKIYLRCMQGVGHETGFRQLLITADQVQSFTATGRGEEMRQTVASGAMPWPMRVVTLLDSACAVDDRFRDYVATLATKSGAEYMPAPLKGLFRISEKLWLRPTRNPDPQKPFFPRGDCTNMCDVVRGMVVCSSMHMMSICLGLLAACDINIWRGQHMARRGQDDVTAAQAAGIVEEVNILSLKNRFKRPTSSGWADIMIKFSFASDPDQHICELQLVHRSMLTARKHCNAHTEYAKFRTALEMLETFGLAHSSVDVSQATRASGDLEDHLDFVRSQEKEYQDYLHRYQRAMGIVLSKSNNLLTSKDDKEPSRNQSSSTCEELCIELEQIQKKRQEDEKRRQEDDKKYEMQLEEIRSKLEKLSSATRIEKI